MPVSSNLTPRFALLRSVCCLSFASFIVMPFTDHWIIDTAISLFIFVHHIATAFGPRFSLNGLGDLIITAAEIGALGWVATVASKDLDGWSAPASILTAVLWWILLIFVALFAILKVVNTIAVQGRNLLRRLDVTDACWMQYVSRNDSDDDFETSTKSIGRPDKVTAGDVLLGRSLWQAKLAGEQNWMIFSRGFFAALFVFIMVIFGIFNIIFEPLRETALLPNINLRTIDLPDDVERSDAVWNVVLRKLSSDNTTVNRFRIPDVVKVISLSNSDNAIQSGDSCPNQSWDSIVFKDAILDTIIFYCFPKTFSSEEPTFRETHPDLLVTVNFTKLQIPLTLITNVAENSVQLLLGFLNNTEIVIADTSPVTLIPGMNAFATTDMIIRRRLQTPILSTFGLFGSYHTYYVSEIIHLIQDPSSSPLISRSPDVATIRISRHVKQDKWRIIQDSRDKSVLRGFSTVGGLWTAIGGIFVIFFGTSIVRVMFNIKPLSVLGLAHSTQQERIRDSCLKKYPRIPYDLQTSPEDRGLVSLLSDHLIDLDFLQSQSEMQTMPDTIPLTGPSPLDDVEDRHESVSPHNS